MSTGGFFKIQTIFGDEGILLSLPLNIKHVFLNTYDFSGFTELIYLKSVFFIDLFMCGTIPKLKFLLFKKKETVKKWYKNCFFSGSRHFVKKMFPTFR